jgi:DNA-binding NarL/FixJ family response regulator
MSNRHRKGQEAGVSVAVFAGQLLVRESLKYMIESSPDLCVGELNGFTDESWDVDALKRADVAVMYFNTGASVENISRVREVNPNMRIVVITDGNDLETQTEALRLGAVGIVKAEQSAKLLLEAIRQTHKGETWLNQALLNRLLEGGKPASEKRSNGASKIVGIEALTAREIEVIEMIGRGLKSKAIAARMFISEATVRHHLSSIYGKLGVDDRLNLVIFAYQNGLVQFTHLPEDISMSVDRS